MALALDRPQLESQTGAQGMTLRDHACSGQLGAVRQGVAVEPHQVGNEEEQPAHARGELARSERELAHVGDRLNSGANPDRALLVEATRQPRKPLLGEDRGDRFDASRSPLLLEGRTDVVDRVVALAQCNDLLADAALLGLRPRSRSCGGEKLWQLTVAKGVAEHAKGTWFVAEPARRRGRRQALEEECSQSLVLALARGGRLLEEAAAERYVISTTDSHRIGVSHATASVKPVSRHQLLFWQEVRILCGFLTPCRIDPHLQCMAKANKETPPTWLIRVAYGITISGKKLSQMNPLAKSRVR